MLKIAVGALLVALVAGALGFSGIARGAAFIAKVVFGIMLVVAVVVIALVALGVSLFAAA